MNSMMSDVVSRLILHYENKVRVRTWIIHHVIELFRFTATHISLAFCTVPRCRRGIVVLLVYSAECNRKVQRGDRK